MPAGIDQFGRLNLPILDEVAIVKRLIDDQPDLVARLDLGTEVNLPLEDLCQFRSEILAPGEVGKSGPERTLDFGSDRRLSRVEIELLDFCLVRIGAFQDLKDAFVIDLIFESLQSAVALFFETKC